MLNMYITSTLDTFISSITTDLKMLICSYEHLVVGNVVLLWSVAYINMVVLVFGIKHLKKQIVLITFSCIHVYVFGYHIQSSPFNVCKINRSDIVSSMILDTYLTSINKSIYTRVVLENIPCIWNVYLPVMSMWFNTMYDNQNNRKRYELYTR